MKRFFLVLVSLLAICPLSGSAQEPVKPLPLWLERAQAESSLIAALAFNFTKFDQAILYSQLGSKWWTTDEARAREWWKKAVEIAAFVPLQESVAERRMRITALNAALRNVGAHDQQLAQRLAEALKALAKQTTDPGNRQELGFSLQGTATALLADDPRVAKDLFLAGLQTGTQIGMGRLSMGSMNLNFFLSGLRDKDARLAEDLFAEVLLLARATHNDELLSGLVDAMYFVVESMGNGSFSGRLNYNSPPRVPEVLQLQVWNAVIERLLIVPGGPEEKTRYCRFVSGTVAAHRDRLQRLFPDRAQIVPQALLSCQQVFSENSYEGRTLAQATGAKLAESREREAPKTVDELIELARKQTDPKTRTGMLWHAAEQAAQQKDYEQASSILDGMTKEERQIATNWDTWRALYAVAGAQRHFAQKEYGEARKMLEAVPDRLAASALIEYLRDFAGMGGERGARGGNFRPELGRDFKASEEEKIMLLDWLNEARKKLSQADFSSTEEAANKSFSLVLLYAVLSHAEALPVFREAVRVLNQEHAEEEKAKANESQESLGWWHQVDLPPSFVKEFFDGIRVAVNEMDSKNLQIRMHLGLLDNALSFNREEMAEKKKPAATPKAESKKAQPTKP